MSVQARIRECLEEKGLSPAAFAKRWGHNHPTVYRWLEEGANVPVGFLQDVASEFDVTLDWLATGLEPKARSHIRVLEEQAEFLRKHQPDAKGQFDLPVQLQHLSTLEVLSPEEYRVRVGELEGPESYTAIPLVADPVAAGAGTVIDSENIEGFAVIYSGWVPPGRVTCVRVTGDSMIPTLRPDSLIAVHHDDKAIRDGSLYCLFDRTADGAIVKRVRTTNIEGEFLVESDNPDKRRHPTMIWKADGDGDAQGFDLIGRVIWGWTLF